MDDELPDADPLSLAALLEDDDFTDEDQALRDDMRAMGLLGEDPGL